MCGWYGALALIFLSLTVYNAIQGLNGFASLPMFIELGIGMVFAVPALWAYRRRARLDAYVAEGSTLLPRHLKTWQHMTILLIGVPVLLIGVPVGLIVVSRVVVTGLATESAPSEEEMRSQEINEIQASTVTALNGLDPTKLGNLCANLADPSERGKLRQRFAEDLRLQLTKRNEAYLTNDEVAQIKVSEILVYCGFSQ